MSFFNLFCQSRQITAFSVMTGYGYGYPRVLPRFRVPNSPYYFILTWPAKKQMQRCMTSGGIDQGYINQVGILLTNSNFVSLRNCNYRYLSQPLILSFLCKEVVPKVFFETLRNYISIENCQISSTFEYEVLQQITFRHQH